MGGSLLFGTLDACLGPGSVRFFGAGYKRVGQSLSQLDVDGVTVPGAGVTALASLSYPTDWSRKAAGRALKPHLSSIDALVLAVSLAEVHLAVASGLSDAEQRQTWLRRAEVRAAPRPQEDLDGFPVSARLLRSTEDSTGFADTPMSSEYDCKIGTLRVRCTLAHVRGAPSTGRRMRYRVLEDALGPAVTRLYGDAYKCHELHAGDVTVALAEQRVRARQYVEPGPPSRQATRGAEAAYVPSVSVIDGVVGIAQLAQTLLYVLDGVRRDNSDTLWMRRFGFQTDTPVRPCGEPFTAEAVITVNRLLRLGADTWRTVELTVDNFAGIGGWCSIAHRLPTAPAEYLELARVG